MAGDGFGSAAHERRLRKPAEELGVVDPEVPGILVPCPLPGHIDAAAVFRALHPLHMVADVDFGSVAPVCGPSPRCPAVWGR